MARIRTVKPEFWTSEQICACSRDARLLLIGLFNFSDCQGVHKFSPARIKSEIFPEDEDIDPRTIREWTLELISNGLIGVYVVDGVEYLHILTFQKHQRIDNPHAKYPKPPKSPAGYKEWTANDLRTTADLFEVGSTMEGKGARIGREEDNPPPPLNSRVEPGTDSDFEIWYRAYPLHKGRGQAERAYATARRNGATVEQLLAGAKRAAATAVGVDPKYVKHPATWLNGKCWLDGKSTNEAGSENDDANGVQDELENKRSEWRVKVKIFRESGRWMRGDGPNPDEPGCRAPRDILAEFAPPGLAP